jgi:hypothetical protein
MNERLHNIIKTARQVVESDRFQHDIPHDKTAYSTVLEALVMLADQVKKYTSLEVQSSATGREVAYRELFRLVNELDADGELERKPSL